MKIYTVLSNHYDYYGFTDWIMTTTCISEVNNFLDSIKKREDEISSNIPRFKRTPVFFVEDGDGVVPYNDDCASREQEHIIVMVKEVNIGDKQNEYV